MHVQSSVSPEDSQDGRGGEEHHINAELSDPGQTYLIGHTAAKNQRRGFPGLCHRHWCPRHFPPGFSRCRHYCSRPAEAESGCDGHQAAVESERRIKDLNVFFLVHSSEGDRSSSYKHSRRLLQVD